MLLEIGVLLMGAVAVAGVLTTKDKDLDAILGEYRENKRIGKAQARFDRAMSRGEAWHNRTTELSREGVLREVSSRVPALLDDEATASKLHLHHTRVKEWRATEVVLAPALAVQKKQVDDAFEALVAAMDAYAHTERQIVAVAPAGAGIVRVNKAEELRTAHLEWRRRAFPPRRSERPQKRVTELDVLKEFA